MNTLNRTDPRLQPHRVFVVAWTFLLVVAVLGVLLRATVLYPVSGFEYGNVLHAHSHLGFLGWVFNAFFALALRHFVVAEDARWFWRLFWVLQVANVGMLASFPVQGYGPVSIAFSTVHMIGGAAFAWRIWRRNRASPLACSFLRVGLVFMLVSGLGPLTLGPLAAMEMRESPWYSMSIYFYLHFQYNGWFVFFLLAIVLQRYAVRDASDAGLGWLAGGCVGTFALSALWLEPPRWVFVVAGGGGLAQVIGTVLFLRAVARGRGNVSADAQGIVATLPFIAFGSFVLKNLLQLAGAWPGLMDLVNHRFVVIGFLHLVFLGVVAPMACFWAFQERWLPESRRARWGVSILLVGVFWTLGLLFCVPVGALTEIPVATHLFASALVMLAGVVVAFPRPGVAVMRRFDP